MTFVTFSDGKKGLNLECVQRYTFTDETEDSGDHLLVIFTDGTQTNYYGDLAVEVWQAITAKLEGFKGYPV